MSPFSMVSQRSQLISCHKCLRAVEPKPLTQTFDLPALFTGATAYKHQSNLRKEKRKKKGQQSEGLVSCNLMQPFAFSTQ